MIIRRRHTANFTTIGNALFEDERLAADEVGILAYLLSRPDNWEVRRPALMRRWGVGRDAIRRIIHSWMRTGWCHAEKRRRTDNGTFEVFYEIRDEPGPSLTEEEVTRALSLVSSEAVREESAAESAPGAPPDTGPPLTPQPHLVEPSPDRAQVANIKEQNTDSPRKDSTQKVEREAAREHAKKAKGLAAFEARWPTAAADNRAKTAAAWAALPEEEEVPAIAGIAAFVENLKRLGRKHIPAGWKYLEDRPWKLLSPANDAIQAPGGPYEAGSETGRALLVLERIARKTFARDGHNRLIYPRPVNPQLLALATPAEGWPVYPFGSKNFFAWREFLQAHVTNLGRLTEVEAPWPYPPSTTGKIYDQEATGPPPERLEGTLATEDDLREMAKG